jgi:hypothetical protein
VLRSRWKKHESYGSGDPNDGQKVMKKATVIICLFPDVGGVLLALQN